MENMHARQPGVRRSDSTGAALGTHLKLQGSAAPSQHSVQKALEVSNYLLPLSKEKNKGNIRTTTRLE